MRKYWVGQEESFVDVMARETVPLLVLNQELLDRNQMESAPARELIDADASALREGFIPHWGPLWVAGRHFPAGSAARDFTIYAPGRYTVEGAATRIDGETGRASCRGRGYQNGQSSGVAVALQKKTECRNKDR